MSSIQQQREIVEQLRREASIKRISVSQAIEDIKVIFQNFSTFGLSMEINTLCFVSRLPLILSQVSSSLEFIRSLSWRRRVRII